MATRTGKGGQGARTPGKAARGGRAKTSRSAARPRAEQDAGRWLVLAAAVIGGVTAFRLGVNAFDLVPIHFDEAQYWAYGQELAWGYFSKPPLVGAVIRVATDLGGETLFVLRAAAPLAHALVAALLFLTGRRMFDGATGFWAAVAYLAAPGVTVSSMVMTTDPVMMACWAVALHAWLRASEAGPDTAASRRWWVLMGVAMGLGALAKYTMIAMPAAALGYGLFSARAEDRKGALIAAAVAVAVLGPNLLWNAANGFPTIGHVAGDADPGRGYFNPMELAGFVGAQLGVIGPVVFVGILAAFWRRRDWIDDWRMRMLAWQTGLLLAVMIGLSFLTRAQPNWAAPAYVAGALFATRWLLVSGLSRTLRWQAGVGVVAAAGLYGLAGLYGTMAADLPRVADPFKKMRIGGPFCERALAAMAEEGAEALLSDDRRRLSECMFLGGLGWDETAVWNPEIIAENHHEMVATLLPGDERLLLLAVMHGGDAIAGRFEEARKIDEGTFRTHADREVAFELWVVQGFGDYGIAY